MNYCNFAKVIIARCSKDSQSIQWWENENQTMSAASTLSSSLKNFSNLVTYPKRYEFYQSVMHKYPKMYLPYNVFYKNISRLQNYITNNKYWKNANSNGEKKQFLHQYSLKSWCALKEREKHLHSIEGCVQCEVASPAVSSLHRSVSKETGNIMSKTEELVEEMNTLTPNRAANASQQMLHILEPIFESNFSTSLKNAVSSCYNLTEKKSSATKYQEKMKESQKSSNIVSNLLSNETEINSFLSSGTSFNQRDRDRLATYFETPEIARERSETHVKEVSSGKKKQKKHVGKFQNYNFDQVEFQKYIEALPLGSKVSWRKLAIKFNVRNKSGIIPSNGGQFLLEYAKSLGVKTTNFNIEKRLSGRDYVQRVRRAKMKLYKRVSIPTPRPTKFLHQAIQRKLKTRDLYIGEKIAPKIYRQNKITTSGRLEETTKTVYGRKIPLENIRKQMNEDQSDFLRCNNHENYENLSNQEIQKRLTSYDMSMPEKIEEALSDLKLVEKTRNLKFWHDHSDILNHSYVSFMVSSLYDPAVYISNEEYKERFPERQPIDVQSAVEKPYLYILGQSKSSDRDQITYTDIRAEDLKDLHKPTVLKGLQIIDKVRVFSGDGPARQFEAGQQRGGHYSCLCGIKVSEHQNLECAMRYHTLSLRERVEVFKQGIIWERFSNENISPFTSLKKDDLIDELEARGIDTFNLSKLEMQEELAKTLHGIQRPPALLCGEHIELDTLSTYEIPACEPLHDITNLVQNLITELPSHIPDKKVQSEFEKFSESTIGDKNQIKGSDARLYAIKLAKFVSIQHSENKISKDFLDLCTSLVDIISICYSHENERSPKKILRLQNQCFIFSYLCKTIIANPKKMTARKFYGCHFHSMTVHAPQTYRLFCLRSLVPEKEERSFGDLRSISVRTSNRQCGKVIDNAVLRYNAQQQSGKKDSYKQQESIISHQAKLLPPTNDSTFPLDLLKKRPYLFQTHCEQIADYLQQGQHYWWSVKDDCIVFHDGPSHPEKPLPSMMHFRSKTLGDQQERTSRAWRSCISDFELQKIQLPMTKIKVFDGEQARVIKNDALFKKENADSFGKESHRGTETEIKADNSQKHKSQSHVLNRKQSGVSSGSVLTYEGDANSDGNGGGQTRTGLEAESTVSKVQHSPEEVAGTCNSEGMDLFSGARVTVDERSCDGMGVEAVTEMHSENKRYSSSAVEGEKDSQSLDLNSGVRVVDGALSFDGEGVCATSDIHSGIEKNPALADSSPNGDMAHAGGKTDKATDSREKDIGSCLKTCPDMEAKICDKDGVAVSEIPQLSATLPRKNAKRKLFANETEENFLSKSNKAGPCKRHEKSEFTGLTGNRQNRTKKTDAESMTRKIHSLLPGDPVAEEYFKYRRLLKGRPHDRILAQSYEVSLAKLQTTISKIHNNLKKTNGDERLLKDAEDLMIHWGIYYF